MYNGSIYGRIGIEWRFLLATVPGIYRDRVFFSFFFHFLSYLNHHHQSRRSWYETRNLPHCSLCWTPVWYFHHERKWYRTANHTKLSSSRNHCWYARRPNYTSIRLLFGSVRTSTPHPTTRECTSSTMGYDIRNTNQTRQVNIHWNWNVLILIKKKSHHWLRWKLSFDNFRVVSMSNQRRPERLCCLGYLSGYFIKMHSTHVGL